MHHHSRSSWLLLPLVLSIACAGSQPASPAPAAEGEDVDVAAAAPAATEDTCASSYDVDAAISSDTLSMNINGNTFTDSEPFKCTLATASSTVGFAFEASVIKDRCPYALTYVDGDGNSFSGTQTLSCSIADLDFTATATPDSTNSACRGKTTLVDDPKIKLNKDNCGQDVGE